NSRGNIAGISAGIILVIGFERLDGQSKAEQWTLAVHQAAVGAFDSGTLSIQDKVSLSAAQGAGHALLEKHEDADEGAGESQGNDKDTPNGLHEEAEPLAPSNCQAGQSEHHP